MYSSGPHPRRLSRPWLSSAQDVRVHGPAELVHRQYEHRVFNAVADVFDAGLQGKHQILPIALAFEPLARHNLFALQPCGCA